jgi:hypothetical protein
MGGMGGANNGAGGGLEPASLFFFARHAISKEKSRFVDV